MGGIEHRHDSANAAVHAVLTHRDVEKTSTKVIHSGCKALQWQCSELHPDASIRALHHTSLLLENACRGRASPPLPPPSGSSTPAWHTRRLHSIASSASCVAVFHPTVVGTRPQPCHQTRLCSKAIGMYCRASMKSCMRTKDVRWSRVPMAVASDR